MKRPPNLFSQAAPLQRQSDMRSMTLQAVALRRRIGATQYLIDGIARIEPPHGPCVQTCRREWTRLQAGRRRALARLEGRRLP